MKKQGLRNCCCCCCCCCGYLALLDCGQELLVLLLADLEGLLQVDEDIFDDAGHPILAADGVDQAVHQLHVNVLHLRNQQPNRSID